MTNTERIFTAIIYIAAIAFFGWLFISWFDVMAHQTTGGTDAAWNIFNIWS